MKKILTKILVLNLFIVLFNILAYSQDSDSGIVKTEDGILLVSNRSDTAFTIEFKGENFKTLESDHPVFVLDKVLWQVVDVEISQFKPASASTQKSTDEELLEMHKKWESEYIGSSMNTKLNVSSEMIELPNKRKAMIWSFAMPKQMTSDFSHQIFLTTVIGKRVLAVNTSVDVSEKFADAKTRLVDTMKTLKTSSTPFNLKKISEEIKKQGE